MDKGKIVMDNTPKKVFSEVKKLKELGLDVPQTTELLYELNREGVPVNYDILSVEECADEIMRVLGGGTK